MSKTNKEDKINKILKQIDSQNKDSYENSVGTKIEELSLDLGDIEKYPKTKPYLLSFLKKHPHIKTIVERNAKRYLDDIYLVETYAKSLPNKDVRVYYYIEYFNSYGMDDGKGITQEYTRKGFIRFLKENI